MHISNKDVFWNYGATFLKLASSILLFPLILRMMPSETVGIWTIFMTITAFASLLDFGFSGSFTRNVTYVFSGVKTLKAEGFEIVKNENNQIDYGLLKGVINSMRWLYARIAFVLFLLLITIGTYYIYSLMENYNGSRQEVYIAWIILCIISTYNLYTLYYDSLLQGKGLIKRSKQIIIIGQTAYLCIASLLILLGNGIIAIVCAQASSVFIIRWLAYKSFFTKSTKHALQTSQSRNKKEILDAITPNAVKVGLTALGGFMVSRSAIIIGSLYLPLASIASYGITNQLIGVIISLAGIYTMTFQPKISQLRILQNIQEIKNLYLKGQLVLLITFIIGGAGLLILGRWGLDFIGSKTQIIPNAMISGLLIVTLLENNHAIAGAVLLTKNEVPFFKASLISGLATILILFLFFKYSNLGLWAMIAAPGIAQAVYQNWKWPYEVTKDLNISLSDVFKTYSNLKVLNFLFTGSKPIQH